MGLHRLLQPAEPQGGVSAPDSEGERYVIRAVDRSLAVLVQLASVPGGLDVSTVAKAVDLHVSTVFRILQTLKLRGFVMETPGGQYRVGPRAFEVGSSFLQGTSLRSQAEEFVELLATRTGETASIGILDSDEVLYIAIANGQRELGIQSAIGTRHPLHCTALGKVLLSGLSWPQARSLLAGRELTRMTENTIVDLDRWQTELATVATCGYAIDSEERILGVRCVAAPVRDHSGSIVAALSASGPAIRVSDVSLENLVSAVQELATQFSRVLGHKPGA
jgi:DNA-binding IclR family transcriptional regulator